MTDTPQTAPALTPEEWANAHGSLESDASHELHWGASVFFEHDDPRSIHLRDDNYELRRHALAALCLYQQPFGFSHADVTLLEDAQLDIGGTSLDSLIGRIVALLPPQPISLTDGSEGEE